MVPPPKSTAQRSLEYRQRRRLADEDGFKKKKAEEMRCYRSRRSQKLTEREKRERREYERLKKRRQREKTKKLKADKYRSPYGSSSSLGKAIAKVKRNLPRSPRKSRIVVQRLADNFGQGNASFLAGPMTK